MGETTQTQTRVSGAGCVQNHLVLDSPRGKKLPTLLREWVTSSYLANRLARFTATLASWMINIAQNCQLLVRRLGARLEVLADKLSYQPAFAPEIGGLTGETNIFPSLYHFIT